MQAHVLEGRSDFARVDLILDSELVPQILEINTIPVLTETGITPAAADAAGMTFTQFVEKIVQRVVSPSPAGAS